MLFLIAVFTTLASLVLRDRPPEWLRATVTPLLAILCLSVFLVTIYSGGVRSHSAHAHLQPQLSGTGAAPFAPRRPPDSVLSYALSVEDLLHSLRGEATEHFVGTGNGAGRVQSSGGSAQRTYVVDVFHSDELSESVAETASAMQPLLRPSDNGAVFLRSEHCEHLSVSRSTQLGHELTTNRKAT